MIFIFDFYNKIKLSRVHVTTNFHDIFRNSIYWLVLFCSLAFADSGPIFFYFDTFWLRYIANLPKVAKKGHFFEN